MTDPRLDLRGMTVPEAGNALLGAYDAAAPGETIAARLDTLPPALKMWLLEAGAHYTADDRAEDGVRMTVTRARSPALTAAPGAHHIVGERNGSLWVAGRAARVARLDPGTGDVAACAEVAKKASHMALDASGRWLYLGDFGTAELVVLDAETLAVEARFPAPGGPQLPAAVGEGMACLTGPGRGTLTIARRVGGAFEHRMIEVGDTPHDTVAAGDGVHAFVACSGSGDVAKVDVVRAEVVGRVPAGAGAGHIAAHPDGQRFYCPNSFDGTLTAFTADGAVVATVACGGWAHHPEVSADGAHVYVGNFLDDTVTVFDAETLDRIAELETEPYAHDIAVSPDGTAIVLPGYSSDHVRIYDTATHTLRHRVEVGAGSPHAAFADGGRLAYVTCSVADHIAQVDMATGTVLKTVTF